jgi:hypothetical protein
MDEFLQPWIGWARESQVLMAKAQKVLGLEPGPRGEVGGCRGGCPVGGRNDVCGFPVTSCPRGRRPTHTPSTPSSPTWPQTTTSPPVGSTPTSRAAKKGGRADVSPPSGPAGPSATNRDHAISEIVFGSGGEDPIGADLQDAERLLDQGRCDAAPAHRSDNTARGLPLASNAQSNHVFGTTPGRQSR